MTERKPDGRIDPEDRPEGMKTMLAHADVVEALRVADAAVAAGEITAADFASGLATLTASLQEKAKRDLADALRASEAAKNYENFTPLRDYLLALLRDNPREAREARVPSHVKINEPFSMLQAWQEVAPQIIRIQTQRGKRLADLDITTSDGVRLGVYFVTNGRSDFEDMIATPELVRAVIFVDYNGREDE